VLLIRSEARRDERSKTEGDLVPVFSICNRQQSNHRWGQVPMLFQEKGGALKQL
jgi:hypothetical protein